MKKSGIVAGVALVSAVGFALLGGCGGGGGGGGGTTRTAKFTAADTQIAVDELTDAVGGCTQPAPERQAVSMAKASTKTLGVVAFASLALGRVQDVGDYEDDPACGASNGTLSVAFNNHTNGDTFFDVSFDAFCSYDPVSGNKTFLTGDGEYVWDGTSTNDVVPGYTGNRIYAEKFSTDSAGLRAVTTDSGDVTVADTTSVLTGYTRTRATWNYKTSGGSSPVWTPVNPSSINAQDKETITKLVVTDNLSVDGDKTTFTSLKGSVYNTGGDHVLTVTGGTGKSTAAGTYTVATEDGSPIIFRDKDHVAGGTLVITGSNSTVKITAASEGDNDFTVSVKGSDTAGDFQNIPVECGAVEFGYYFVGIDE